MAFRELIQTNFRRKLFSLLLAILVWATIHFTENRQRRSPSWHRRATMFAAHRSITLCVALCLPACGGATPAKKPEPADATKSQEPSA